VVVDLVSQSESFFPHAVCRVALLNVSDKHHVIFMVAPYNDSYTMTVTNSCGVDHSLVRAPLPAGRSNALNIAARLGLDTRVIAAARRRLGVGVAAANEAIEELEKVQDQLQQEETAAWAVDAGINETKVGI
jgi:hypothetical protein